MEREKGLIVELPLPLEGIYTETRDAIKIERNNFADFTLWQIKQENDLLMPLVDSRVNASQDPVATENWALRYYSMYSSSARKLGASPMIKISSESIEACEMESFQEEIFLHGSSRYLMLTEFYQKEERRLRVFKQREAQRSGELKLFWNEVSAVRSSECIPSSKKNEFKLLDDLVSLFHNQIESNRLSLRFGISL